MKEGDRERERGGGEVGGCEGERMRGNEGKEGRRNEKDEDDDITWLRVMPAPHATL